LDIYSRSTENRYCFWSSTRFWSLP